MQAAPFGARGVPRPLSLHGPHHLLPAPDCAHHHQEDLVGLFALVSVLGRYELSQQLSQCCRPAVGCDPMLPMAGEWMANSEHLCDSTMRLHMLTKVPFHRRRRHVPNRS